MMMMMMMMMITGRLLVTSPAQKMKKRNNALREHALYVLPLWVHILRRNYSGRGAASVSGGMQSPRQEPSTVAHKLWSLGV